MKNLFYLPLAAMIIFSACKRNDSDPEPTNGAPVVVSDTYSIDANSSNNTLSIMANDTDPEGDSLVITDHTSPVGGYMLTGFSTKTGKSWFSYTPPFNFIGTTTFSYTLSDGKGNSTNGTVTVNVGNAAQLSTYAIISPFLDKYVLLDNSSSKHMSINTGINTISSYNLVSPFSNGEDWLLRNDGKLHITSGSTAGFDFTVEKFTATLGAPAFKLTSQGTSYYFYEEPFAIPTIVSK